MRHRARRYIGTDETLCSCWGPVSKSQHVSGPMSTACISLPSLAGQGHMESRWARDESPWPLASRPLAAAALSSRFTVAELLAELCLPAITVKACRPPTAAGRARRVKPPIPNQDDRYHPLACIPTIGAWLCRGVWCRSVCVPCVLCRLCVFRDVCVQVANSAPPSPSSLGWGLLVRRRPG